MKKKPHRPKTSDDLPDACTEDFALQMLAMDDSSRAWLRRKLASNEFGGVRIYKISHVLWLVLAVAVKGRIPIETTD
jgi:hypothetical protein